MPSHAHEIRIENLSVFYGPHCALENVSLSIAAGELAVIIGPNGGGKSTLLKAILGLAPLHRGRILIDGQALPETRPAISYVPQRAAINPSFPISVREVVLQGRMPARLAPAHSFSRKDRELTEEYMQRLEIGDLAGRQIARLSGGQLQRVLLARALVRQAGLLLLDEPTAHLDAVAGDQIFRLLQDLKPGVTVLMVSHDTRPLNAEGVRVIGLNRRLFYEGPPGLSPELLMRLYAGRHS
ncbi:MAG: ABC transporter ATP-binding protein [Syntrophomonadaceae bacterium]|nr:ABC transporter ATP-binding protein [Syntrophomonadaceae bacterium]